jgi:ferredoxin
MGMCLKYCMPRARRYFDKSFTPSTRRRRDVVEDVSKKGLARAMAHMEEIARTIGVDKLICVSEKTLEKMGLLPTVLPTCHGAVIIAQRFAEGADASTLRTAQRNALWVARRQEIDLGFDTLVESGIDPQKLADNAGVSTDHMKMHVMLTSFPLEDSVIDTSVRTGIKDLRKMVKTIAENEKAPLCGVSPVSRLDEVASQFDEIYSNEDYFISKEQGWGLRASRAIEMKGKPKNPAIVKVNRISKRAEGYVRNAKSVIVVGLPALRGSVKNVLEPPAQKAVHYAVTVHKELVLQSEALANRIALELIDQGYHAAVTMNLDGMAPISYAWQLPSLGANHMAAVCAGLADLGKNRLAITEEFASHVRYAAVITDAEIVPDRLLHLESLLCQSCDICVKKCPAQALTGETIDLHIEGETYRCSGIDQLRCDWAAQYGLLGDEGPKYLGSTTDIPVPENITPEVLKEAVLSSDRLQISNFAPIVEHCALDCPYVDVRR